MSVWRELLEHGRWAASPHNMQTWRLRPLSESEAELLYDPARLLPDTDPAGRFVTVGLGVFVETLSVAAGARGRRVEVELAGAPLEAGHGGALPFARLRLVPAAKPEPLARDLILRRRTARGSYDGRPVDEETLRRAAASSAALGHRFTWSGDPVLVRWLLDLNQAALFFDMTDPRARREVGSWLRFSSREARRRADGFAPRALGFPGLLLWAFFHLRPAFDLPGVRPIVRRYYLRTMRGTRTVAWLHGPFETAADWLSAGRMLCRLWLELTAAGVRLHPFGSVVTNEIANRALEGRIGHDPDAGTLWLVLRLGYGTESPPSYRLGIDELLVD